MSIELITSSVAIITSLSAIFLSIWTIRMQRIHNYKSVKPIAYVDIYDYPNHTAVEITNSGLGPMTITGIRFSNENSRTDNIQMLISPILKKTKLKNFNPELVGSVIVPGKSVNIIDLRTDVSNKVALENRNLLRQLLGSMTLQVDYDDIYDRRQESQYRRLKIFQRDTNWNDL